MMHYFKAVKAANSTEAVAVMAAMRSMPTDDPLFGHGAVRPDGRVVHNMYLFQVKTPAESRAPWDDYKLIQTIPAEQAFRPPGQGACPLAKTRS